MMTWGLVHKQYKQLGAETTCLRDLVKAWVKQNGITVRPDGKDMDVDAMTLGELLSFVKFTNQILRTGETK